MVYFLHISYDGTNYQGWQYQKDAISIQGTIEKTLKKILKKEITVEGCGRTDAGVHASQYILHINIEPITYDLKDRLNRNLPKDIVVYDVIEMKPDQHSRFDASERTYDYFIHLYDDPFLNRVSSQYYHDQLDYDLMEKAVELISTTSDFKGFCKQPHLYESTKCKIKHVKLYRNTEQNRIRLSITSDRFLRGMIRLIVSYLLKVGTKKMSLDDFKLLIKNELYVADKSSALPNGLYLSRIEYPYLSIEPKTNICSFLKKGLE